MPEFLILVLPDTVLTAIASVDPAPTADLPQELNETRSGLGPFTITLSGMTRTVEGAVSHGAGGHAVTLSVASAGVRGTSSTAAIAGIGLPAVLWSVADRSPIAHTADSGASYFANAQMAVTRSITFFERGEGRSVLDLRHKVTGSRNHHLFLHQ